MKTLFALLVSTPIFMTAASAHAEDYTITLDNHRFTPQTITLPAHQKVKLTVKNLQASSAEFESEELDREKVVAAGSSVSVLLGPLEPGTYDYVDDFHRDTKGVIVVR